MAADHRAPRGRRPVSVAQRVRPRHRPPGARGARRSSPASPRSSSTTRPSISPSAGSRRASASCRTPPASTSRIALIPYTHGGIDLRARLPGQRWSTRCWCRRSGIVLATILGFIIGVARLSRNWLIAHAGGGLCRRHPQHPAAGCRSSSGTSACCRRCRRCGRACRFFDTFFLSNRGLYMPTPQLQPGFWIVPTALVVGIVAAIVLSALGAAGARSDGPAVPQRSGPALALIDRPAAAGHARRRLRTSSGRCRS